MPKLEITNDNMFSKVTTGGDYNRPLGVLKDVLVIVSSGQAASRIVSTSFKYLIGVHELEVYVNGVYKRRNETINSIVYGDYSEYSNFSVYFNVGVISVGDRVRFRITSANYKITNVSGRGDINSYLYTTLIPYSTWLVNHNLGNKYVNVIVYDSTDNVVIPFSITLIDNNNLTITFSENISGHAIILSSGGNSGGTAHTIEYEGSPLPAREKLNFVGSGVNVSDDGPNTTLVTISGGGTSKYLYSKLIANTIWLVTHNLGIKYVNVIVYDTTDNVVIPSSIVLTDDNNLTITFSEVVSGHAIIIG